MIVGAMLTSLVVAREYESGTMETIRSLPVSAAEFLTGKAIPYFIIGLIDVLVAILMGQLLFGVVMKSSFWLMILASSLYLGVALSLGLLISSVTQSQLVANQLAVLITYLPSLLLVQFRLSRGEHAGDSATGYPDCSGHLFYRYFKWPLSAEPRTFDALAQLSDTGDHVRRAFGIESDRPEKRGAVDDPERTVSHELDTGQGAGPKGIHSTLPG